MDTQVFGFLNIDKALGATSHDIVAQIRRELKLRKVGHAGTLDPLATGVLVICLGRATRLSEYVMHSTKRYLAHVHFGTVTATDDGEGEIIAERATGALTRADVEAMLPAFTGTIMQKPPVYSAIKQNGRKLYELARAGTAVDVPPRPVQIDSIVFQDWQPPVAVLEITCSAGTYIRSLARDLGEAVGVGAHLAGLRRVMSGNFLIEDAVTLDEVLADPNWTRRLVPPQRALANWRRIDLDPSFATTVAHGGTIPAEAGDDRELALTYAPGGDLLAVVRREEDAWVPQKVFWRD
ncbi:MAG: tRNA pseudouridine(55) synthase TruB [Anaerolineae bacterium]|nr:tRNA pseudouridine(55) synthase TruB [Anaerolineae bacterium]